jgi:hypothetical protein
VRNLALVADRQGTVVAAAVVVSGLEVLAEGAQPGAFGPVAAPVAGARPAVIGESMSRVRAAAARLDAETFETTAKTAKEIWRQNSRWLRTQIRAGREIVDIGTNPTRCAKQVLPGRTGDHQASRVQGNQGAAAVSGEYLPSLRRAMQPVMDRFGFRVNHETETDQVADLVMVNETTAVRVVVDWTEFRPLLTVYQLVAGALPPEPEVDPRGQLQAFDVDDLLLLRATGESPVGKMFSHRSAGDVETLVGEYAEALQRDAADVLSGDFSVFRALNQIVAKRRREMRQG